MAITAFGTNDSQTVKLWSKMTMRETLKSTLLFKKFLGKGKGAILQRITDLEKSAGDQVKFDLLMKMSNDGVTGDNRLKGNEEALTYHQDNIVIDQLRNAHAFRRMSSQRTLHDLRSDGKENLSVWFAEKMEQYMFRSFCGDTTLTHGAARVAPDTAHQVFANDQASEAAVVSDTAQLTLDELDYAKEKAMMADPPMRPVRIDGDEYFVAVVHPYGATDLRLNLGSGSAPWMTIQQYANVRGLKNPIFQGSLGVYNKIIMFESAYIHSPITNCYRNLLLGAQAGVYAVGNAYDKTDQVRYGNDNMMSWTEDNDDYKNEKGIAVGSIFNVDKCMFNSAAYGVMVISSYSTAKR